MKKFLSLFLLIGISLVSGLATADDLLSCVDPDIAHTLLGNPGEGSIQISRDWPDRYPTISVPDEFEFIGSRTSVHYSLLSFKSPNSLSQAKSDLEESMLGSDWQLTPPIRARQSGGFQSSSPVSTRGQGSSFCHEEHGQMSVMYSKSSDESSYITLLKGTHSSRMSCSDIGNMMMANFRTPVTMPLLSLPDGVVASGGGGGIMSSDGGHTSTKVQLISERSSSELLTFFGSQLINQQWEEEGSWTGKRISGSAWISEDSKTSGLLRVQDQGNNRNEFEFEITQHQ